MTLVLGHPLAASVTTVKAESHRLMLANEPDLARWLLDDLPTFDPSRPDSPQAFAVPPSPTHSSLEPEGS